MRKFSLLIFVLIGLLVCIGIGYFAYAFYLRLHAPAESPFKALPSSTALVIKVNKPVSLLKEAKETNLLWSKLSSIPAIRAISDQSRFLDSTIGSQKGIRDIFKKNPLFIAVVPTFARSYALMFMINTGDYLTEDDMGEYLEKMWPSKFSVEKQRYAGTTIFKVLVKNSKSSWFLAIKSKIWFCSGDASLIRQAVDRLSLNLNFIDDLDFKKVISSSGKNVDVNIFIHYPAIASWVNGWAMQGPLSGYLNVAFFASWSGLDLIQKRDQWMINGYTVCKDSSTDYLS
ncbi:MAG: hypothetical protein WCL00_11460, partial [Bacteroidota bacterium]